MSDPLVPAAPQPQSSPIRPARDDTDEKSTATRILRAGMACFARGGFAGATTRRIAADAGVTLPVIAYHFGNKDGLHRACAKAILRRHQRRLLPLVTAARNAADTGTLDPGEARRWLERILTALIDAITADAGQRLETDFVLREMTEQGPGYALLYAGLWQPGIGLIADLVALARGAAETREQDRLGAVMLLASLSAFTREEPITRAVLDWNGLDDRRRAQIAETAHALLAGLIAPLIAVGALPQARP